MRYEAGHKEKTRDKVLKAAAKAMRARGPARLAVASVMSQAGLTHGGFYAHFDSKDALVAATISQMFEQARERFWRQAQDLPPAQALNAYIDFYLSEAHRDSRTSGCPMPVLAGDLPRLSSAARARFAQGVASLTKAIAQRAEQLELKESEPLARSVVAELVGALSLARAEPNIECSNAMLAASRKLIKERLNLSVGTST
jgi:TetR/AcrR family transcriptional repressor of nem operon